MIIFFETGKVLNFQNTFIFHFVFNFIIAYHGTFVYMMYDEF